MKKIYALAAVAFMALAANAQNGAPLYATGAGDFVGGSWAPGTPDEFSYADGKYTLEVANLTQFKISTVSGEGAEDAWAAFNGGAYTCQYGEEQGVAVALEPGDANIACPWKGDYTITVAGDLSTITLTTSTPKPSGDTPVYLRGDMNGWGAEDAWKMTKIEGSNVYTFTCADDQAVVVGQSFKFADADWDKINVGGDGETVELDLETAVFNGGNPANITLAEEWNGVVFLDLTPDACQVYFSNDKDAENPFTSGVATISADSNVAVKYFNLQGVEVANPENGLFIVVKGNETKKVLVK